MEITKMLTISTAHITEETDAALRRELVDENMELMVLNTDYGYIVYCSPFMDDEHNNGEKIPADLWKCMKFTRKNDCVWLNLDCDGEELAELPTYEW